MDFMILHKWFHENHLVVNPGKFHYTVIGDGDPSHKILVNDNETASSNEEKRLSILLNSKLNFVSHITSLWKKAQQKIKCSCKNKLLPHSRSENLAIKLSSKISIQLLSTDRDVYF